MDLLIAVSAVGFVLALYDAYGRDSRVPRALISFVTSLLVNLPVVSWHDVVRVMAVSFLGVFIVALADRVIAMPITISRAVGNLR